MRARLLELDVQGLFKWMGEYPQTTLGAATFANDHPFNMVLMVVNSDRTVRVASYRVDPNQHDLPTVEVDAEVDWRSQVRNEGKIQLANEASDLLGGPVEAAEVTMQRDTLLKFAIGDTVFALLLPHPKGLYLRAEETVVEDPLAQLQVIDEPLAARPLNVRRYAH